MVVGRYWLHSRHGWCLQVYIMIRYYFENISGGLQPMEGRQVLAKSFKVIPNYMNPTSVIYTVIRRHCLVQWSWT